jgi:hypothetical protein
VTAIPQLRWLADRNGRNGEMLVLTAGAIASAFSPNIFWLIGFLEEISDHPVVFATST